MKTSIAIVLLTALTPAAPAATWLHCGDMLDVETGELKGPHTIVVEENAIASVRDGHRSPDGGAELIDLSGLTCLPGLMDMHTHLSSQLARGSYIERFTLNPADLALRGAEHARITLEAGFTTVRDLGDSFNVTVALRDAVAAGRVPGPRIFTAAKSLGTTGGHADPTNGYRFDLSGDPGPAEGVVNGVEDARRAVRQRYKDGADLIKITATGGVLSIAKSGHNPQFLEEEIRAVVDTARDYEMHVAAHAHGPEGMKRAIRAGVHTIEHGTMMDDEVMALMKEHDTWYVPTILAGRYVADMSETEGFFPALVRPKAAAIGPQIQETFGRAWRAGVKVAFGTDSGVSPHGQNAKEFEYMVETGYPPIEAIRAATVHSAELLGAGDELGTIEPGKLADVIAVDGDPLADVTLLQDVRFVMKDGKVFLGDER